MPSTPASAAAAFEHAGLADAVHAGALGAGQGVGLTELARIPAVLLEPVQAELRVVVEIVFGQEAVDELQGRAHGHGGAVGFEHGGVFAENGHAGADDGLGQIHRSHRRIRARAARHFVQGLGQHRVQFADEFPAGNGQGIGWAFATDKDDG